MGDCLVSKQKRDVSKIKSRVANAYDSVRSVNSFINRNRIDDLPQDFNLLVGNTLKNLTQCLDLLGRIEKQIREERRKEIDKKKEKKGSK